MTATDTAVLPPPTAAPDRPKTYEKPEYNIQLILEQGARRILVSFPDEDEAKAYFDCVQFNNLALKRQTQVYLHLTDVSHITLKNRLGIVFNKAAHAREWLLRTRLERCFRQRQKTLWLKDTCGMRGATWEKKLDAGQGDPCVEMMPGGGVQMGNGGTTVSCTASNNLEAKETQGHWYSSLKGLKTRIKAAV